MYSSAGVIYITQATYWQTFGSGSPTRSERPPLRRLNPFVTPRGT
jgi:hypothetical protein